MASCSRPYLFKAAFLLCILLLLLLNFSIRTNNPTRWAIAQFTCFQMDLKCAFHIWYVFCLICNEHLYRSRITHTVTNGMQWPTPLHSELAISVDGKRSVAHQNATEHTSTDPKNLTNKLQNNNFFTNSTKSTASTVEIEQESVK